MKSFHSALSKLLSYSLPAKYQKSLIQLSVDRFHSPGRLPGLLLVSLDLGRAQADMWNDDFAD